MSDEAERPTMDSLFVLRGERSATAKQEQNYNAKIGRMRRLHGAGPEDAVCVECVHFVVTALARDYRKCVLFGVSGGPGTDWQSRWPACGKFQARPLPRPKRSFPCR